MLELDDDFLVFAQAFYRVTDLRLVEPAADLFEHLCKCLAIGKPLRFVSTHFQHNVPEDRLAEAKAINRLLGNEDELPTILAGDMNAVPDAAPIQELLKHWSNAIDKQATPTAPSAKPTSRIDYIFYQPARMFRVTHTEVVSEAVASDHRPVLAVLEVLPR